MQVLKGGILIVNGFPIAIDEKGVTLENTQIAGGLELLSDVTLESKTELSPTTTLKTKGHFIQNNGELIFKIDNDTNIDAIIYGTGSLTKEGKAILTLSGKRGSESEDYFYSGGTNINGGTLKLSNAIFIGSYINGKKDTDLMLEKSILTSTLQEVISLLVKIVFGI